MPAHCQLTGRQPGFGHHVSHSHRRTKRRFDPNIQRKRYWLPSEGRHVRLTLSAKAIKTVDAIGVEAAVARIRARGEKV
ncbi:50S ribosomal protein L28 [Streptomyces sp. ME19-01-6]|uniref:50S ribosomal protein L28 n=1 Tax=Streptomyces sp. ME19-01-6 TaxID=3028686 RepID=UPI0029B8C9CF|nr:50S ribosomal protein L28 [Streptomyces sp. ME19-01-6]MDX3230082.1 50S ribosomal protein L28 [Streptomyces sp. ME19-01-6]